MISRAGLLEQMECCAKSSIKARREESRLIAKHIIQAAERAFDDFAGAATDQAAIRRLLGINPFKKLLRIGVHKQHAGNAIRAINMERPFLHHILVPAMELDRSRRFYRDVLELEEIDRPVFPYPGAWFQVGNNQQLHVWVRMDATFRGEKDVDPYDVHFALCIKSFSGRQLASSERF